MKLTRGLVISTILLASQTFVLSASGAAVYLPESSHYQGQSYYDSSNVSGYIDFAVYDTETYPYEFVGPDGFGSDLDWWTPAPAENCRYIYAYQVFVTEASSDAIDYFGIIGIGENAIVKDASTNDLWPISGVNDQTGTGTKPDNYPYFGSSSLYGQMGVWQFSDGPLGNGDHSWLLVIGSDNDWTPGNYTFDSSLAGEAPVPNPEPATLILLGLGSTVLLTGLRRAA
jgi:hypothetical protein